MKSLDSLAWVDPHGECKREIEALRKQRDDLAKAGASLKHWPPKMTEQAERLMEQAKRLRAQADELEGIAHELPAAFEYTALRERIIAMEMANREAGDGS